jgi:hypothetical protein
MKINNFAGIPEGHKSPLLQVHRFGFFEVPLSKWHSDQTRLISPLLLVGSHPEESYSPQSRKERNVFDCFVKENPCVPCVCAVNTVFMDAHQYYR